jgi:two-component system sensor histidine kinase BaeS
LDAPRSDRSLRASIVGPNDEVVGWLVLSDGPASGRDVLASVAQALVLAALAAVILAALAGYLLSARISRPLVALTATSDEMADGNLGARADIDRDDEVGRLAVSFNSMADRIEATVTTLRRFVADAAHEIGTPLTALQADLELAEEASDGEDERVFVRRALEQARRIEDLSANLLRLSRLEAGEASGTAERVDLAALMRTTADAAASRAEQAGLELVVHASDGPLEIMGDSAKLQVLIDNLLDNAFKFTPHGGEVDAGVSTDGRHALVWVRDSGIGIPAAEQPEIFSRFYRARNVSAYPGSGLGLAIVQATAAGHGGTVGLHSDETGTRFEVRLPVA